MLSEENKGVAVLTSWVTMTGPSCLSKLVLLLILQLVVVRGDPGCGNVDRVACTLNIHGNLHRMVRG